MKSLILSIIIIFCFSLVYSYSFAETQIEENPKIKIVNNGSQKHSTDVPIMIDGKILLPIKEILNDIGIQVVDENIIYNQSENSINIKTDSLTIYLKSGSKEALINDKPVTLNDTQTIYNKDGLIYSQFEFIAKSFEKRYLFDERNSLVFIIDEKQYLQTKEILNKAFGVIDSAKNYKYSKKYIYTGESKGKKSVFDYTSDFLINKATKIAYEKDKLSTLNKDKTSNLEKESYFSKDLMYYKNSTENKWSWELFNEDSSDSILHENIFDSTFKAFDFLSPDEFFYAGLILQESSSPNEIILKGDINLIKEFNDYFGYSNGLVEGNSEIRINKDTFQINQIINSFSSELESDGVEKFNMTVKYYNITSPQKLEIILPKNLIKVTAEMKTKAVLNQGVKYLEDGRNEDAIKCFDDVIKTQPKNSEAYLNKGKALLDLNRIADAIVLYNKAIKLNKSLTREYSSIGEKYFQLEKYEDSLKYLNMVLKDNLNNGKACFYKAEILFKKSNYKDALDFYFRSATLKYCSYNTLNDQGYWLRINSKYELAILYYDKCIELDKNNYVGYIEKACSLDALHKFGEAIKYYRKALALRKDDIAIYANMANDLDIVNKSLEANVFREEALKIKPRNDYDYNNRGNLLESLGRYDEAIECYDQAIALDPNEPNYYNNKGIILYDLKKYTEAIELYDKAIKINPNYEFAYLNKYDSLMELGKIKEAVIVLEQIKKIRAK